MLTSLTTIAGLTPLLLETSFQAQLLIPMATSLCFGLMLATVVVLYLVPAFYGLYGRIALSSIQEDALPGLAPRNEHPDSAVVTEIADTEPELLAK